MRIRDLFYETFSAIQASIHHPDIYPVPQKHPGDIEQPKRRI